MDAPRPLLPFALTDADDVALAVVDLGVARAFWEGVPAARLLARVRLHRDEHDLVDLSARVSGVDFAEASWDTALARVIATSATSFELVKRRIARHARAATTEGALPASDAAIAALVYALLSSSDDDASPAEGVAEAAPIDGGVMRASARIDERLGLRGADRRGPIFEACIELATKGTTVEHPLGTMRKTLDALGDAPAIVASSAALYPWGERDLPLAQRRACLLERSDLERALLPIDPNRTSLVGPVAEVSALLAKQGSLLALATREHRSHRDAPRLPPASWVPVDLGAPDAPRALASALERGATTAPRVRALLVRSGETALDAAGKEMLDVTAHPFASAVFAEILAGVARERDVVRLVTYFAIAPDPATAARALSLCGARELPGVLRGWLESTLPRERLAACLAALEPYPNLYEMVKPLATRLVEEPGP